MAPRPAALVGDAMLGAITRWLIFLAIIALVGGYLFGRVGIRVGGAGSKRLTPVASAHYFAAGH